MTHIPKSLIGAGIVTLALAMASAAGATDLGVVGGPQWMLNGDGSYSEAITGFASYAGTPNTYSFELAGPATFYDVSVVGNTLRTGQAVSGYLFTLTGPGVSEFASSLGKVADFSETLALVPGDYMIGVTGFATLPTGSTTFGGTVDISPVPLPAALPLFGAVLAALGFYAVRRRDKDHVA
jgi:hypothetical protein